MDLDDFKKLNDIHGHLQGDAMLRDVAKSFQENLRGMDVLARWGGEEFVVLLKGCPLEFAFERGECFRRQVMELSWISKRGEPIQGTLSFGVAQCRAGEAEETLFSRVDDALYRAKRKGKNRGERG
jgi:diguanylate cyclase (GGDEF)-like protein